MGGLSKLSNNQIKELQGVITSSKGKGPEVRRAQAILMVNEGVDESAITVMTGFERRHAFRLRKRYLVEGIGAIKDRREGHPKTILTKQQRDEVIQTLKTKSPRTYGYDTDYWTTALLGYYIKRQYNIRYKSRTSYYIIFRGAEFSYHKPGKTSERRDEQEVQEWRSKAKEQLQSVWNDFNTVVLAEDEMNLSTQTTVQKIWLPKGEYPYVEVARKRESRSIYGFLNIKTGKEHAFKTRWQNMYITSEILPKIRELYSDKKILLLWDQAGWHKGKEAQRVIKEDGNIETIYFPAAAPEQNPQEHVWKNGRSYVSHNEFIQDIDKATDDFVHYLNSTKFSYSLLGFSDIS
jgi:transposase